MSAPRSGFEVEELAALLDAVQDYAIFLLSPLGEIRSWNTGAERLMGYTRDEVVGRHFSIFYDEDELRADKPGKEIAIAVATGRVEDEGWRIRKDGTRFWANTVITPLIDANGAVRALAKVTRDLTARVAAEQRLRQSEELFRLLVESVRDYAIFMLDAQGRVVSWNEGAYRAKQYTAEEIIGRHFSTFYPEADVIAGKPERELEIAIREGRVEDEGWRVRKDGTRFWANVVITAVFDEQRRLRGFAKVTRDITERKRAEEIQRSLMEQREARMQAEEERRRAEASSRAAREAIRAKDEFLMTLSHELRTPMTSILGWSRLLPSLTPGDETFNEAIASIGRSAQVQAQLIDDVLDVSRIMSGKMRLVMERVDVKDVLTNALDTVRPSAAARGVHLASAFSGDVGTMMVDPTRLQQVVWNLLTNAVKFTPREGTIELSARTHSAFLEIAVRDSGEGIDPAFLPHIFEPFRQGENPSTRTHGGLGLGLSIVRYIAEAHGGTVHAESAGPGHGATFTVRLPLQSWAGRTDAQRHGTEELQPVDVTGRLQGVLILLIDDDTETRQYLRAVLLRAGAVVAAVDSARGALSELDTHRPQVIITDIAMPDVDGFELARMIRQLPAHRQTKMIALTAFPSSRLAGAEEIFDGCYTKPIDPVALVEAVEKLTGAK